MRTEDRAQECRLAGTRRPHDANELTAMNGEVDIVNNGLLAVGAGQMVANDEWFVMRHGHY